LEAGQPPERTWRSITDGCVVPRDALFVPPRFVPNSRLLVGLGCDVDGDGWVTADRTLTLLLRTFVLATTAVPIVICALMPQLHRLRVRLIGVNNVPLDEGGA
jgi:hypothetical protein